MLQPALQTSPELDAGLAQLTVRLASWMCGATLLATFPGRVMSGQVIARAGVPSAALKLAPPPDEFSLLLVQALPLKPATSYHFQLVVEPAQGEDIALFRRPPAWRCAGPWPADQEFPALVTKPPPTTTRPSPLPLPPPPPPPPPAPAQHAMSPPSPPQQLSPPPPLPSSPQNEAVVDVVPHPAGQTDRLIESELRSSPSMGVWPGAASAAGILLLGACWATRRWRLRAGHHPLSGEDEGLCEEEEYPQLVPDALSTFDDEIASVAPSLVLRDLAERSARRKVIE